MQHEEGRSRRYNDVVNSNPTMDLIIINVPEGLSVHTMSDPADVVLPWNQSAKSLLEAVFVFAVDYL
jgi:hypothetical protein